MTFFFPFCGIVIDDPIGSIFAVYPICRVSAVYPIGRVFAVYPICRVLRYILVDTPKSFAAPCCGACCGVGITNSLIGPTVCSSIRRLWAHDTVWPGKSQDFRSVKGFEAQ